MTLNTKLASFSILVLFLATSAQAQIKKASKIPAVADKDYWAYIPEASQVKDGTKGTTVSNDAFYMAKFEVTNAMYNEFLMSLSGGEKQERMRKVSQTQLAFQNTERTAYGEHPGFANFPVVDVSLADAQAFAAWLTKIYHTIEKRPFKQVKFSLPNEQQWTVAAKGGQNTAVFPWGGPYLRNAKGQALCNYLRYPETAIVNYLDEEEYKVDVQQIAPEMANAARIASYPANNYGIYDMAGNVSELTTTSFIESREDITAKGGSFAQTGYWAQISTRQAFTKPNFYTGFRLVMEVIEE